MPETSLTKEQQLRATHIQSLKEQVRIAQEALRRELDVCQHVIECVNCHLQTTDEECPADMFGFGHGDTQCRICQRSFGWYCPASPDHKCYYYSDDHRGKTVTLMDGTVVELHNSYDPRYESDDWCLFCRQPDERK